MSQAKEIILGVTGSIAAYKACDILRRLQDGGCHVSVVMTGGAENFITPLTFSSLAGEKVYQASAQKDADAGAMHHIVLAKKADVLLIVPATANIIGKIANGIADDLLTCIALATKAKILIAPAMNDEMYKNKIVQSNIEKLKSFGVEFISPVKGKLACGTFGEGHLAGVEDIVNIVLRSLKK